MRYLIGLIISIAVIIFIIIRLLSGGPKTEPNVTQLPASIGSYANTDVRVRYTIDNPVQAAQDHNDIIITVGRDEAKLSITKGYQGEVINSYSFPSSGPAYANFLLALERSAAYTSGNNDAVARDERGYCATGDRYIYEIIDSDDSVIQHLWSTSCGVKTFKGDGSIAQRLFEDQIPDFSELTGDISY